MSLLKDAPVVHLVHEVSLRNVLNVPFRLSEANIESILGEIEQLYRGHSRNGASFVLMLDEC